MVLLVHVLTSHAVPCGFDRAQMFSYLQFHTQSLDISQEQLEALRLNVAKASPLAAALETCLGLVDAETLPAVVMQIKTVVKTGVGRGLETVSSQ